VFSILMYFFKLFLWWQRWLTWSFRNHFNKMVCFGKFPLNIYLVLKKHFLLLSMLCCLKFLWKLWFTFFRIIWLF